MVFSCGTGEIENFHRNVNLVEILIRMTNPHQNLKKKLFSVRFSKWRINHVQVWSRFCYDFLDKHGLKKLKCFILRFGAGLALDGGWPHGEVFGGPLVKYLVFSADMLTLRRSIEKSKILYFAKPDGKKNQLTDFRKTSISRVSKFFFARRHVCRHQSSLLTECSANWRSGSALGS